MKFMGAVIMVVQLGSSFASRIFQHILERTLGIIFIFVAILTLIEAIL